MGSDLGSICLKERNIKGELTETFMLYSDKTLKHFELFKAGVTVFIFSNLFIEFVLAFFLLMEKKVFTDC